MYSKVSKKQFLEWHKAGEFELVVAASVTKEKLERFLEGVPPEECTTMPATRLELGKNDTCYIWSNGKWEYFVVVNDMQGSDYLKGIYEDTGNRSTVVYIKR